MIIDTSKSKISVKSGLPKTGGKEENKDHFDHGKNRKNITENQKSCSVVA